MNPEAPVTRALRPSHVPALVHLMALRYTHPMRLRPALFPCVLVACDFSASTTVERADTAALDSGASAGGDDGGSNGGGSDGGAGDGGSGDGGSGDGSGSGDDPDPLDVDDDEDGFTENEGDCDDTDPSITPGRVDGCDGVDEDCDGRIDEDAVDEDAYEPNDTTPTDLGDLLDDPSHDVEAMLHDDGDVDRYSFDFEDGSFSLFRIDIGLSNIPDGAEYRLRVRNLSTGQTVHDESGSDSLSVTVNDTLLADDGGVWEAEVSSLGGADCGRRYLLSVRYSD